MNREKALAVLNEKVKTKNLIKHMMAAEAVMKKLAVRMGEDPHQWAMVGLLHDIDYDDTKNDPHRHSLVGAKMLADLGVDEDIVQAVRVHNEVHGIPRVTPMEKALYAVDPLTGLIVAAALIHPSKKIHGIDAEFVLNRFGEKHFARGARRDTIQTCTEFGMTLDDFVALGVEAMQEVSVEIGL